MPIRFACTHCQRALSVPSAKAGGEVTCPRCRKVVLVPDADTPPARTAAPLPPEPTTEKDPYAQFEVHDSEPELFYADHEAPASTSLACRRCRADSTEPAISAAAVRPGARVVSIFP